MKPNTKAQKEVALELLNKLNIYQPYIKGFEEENQVCFFECYAGFWIYQEPEVYAKMKEIERKYGCIVYAVTHEFTQFGELYSFLIVTQYKQEWKHLVHSYGKNHRAFAYVWNKDDDFCSEFGSITVHSFGGGIKRIA
ncbi:MAG: hypothetical protein LUI60_01435 [Clostridia bacterium]|nr:hypothetical protein [Clostridia bacterium]